MKHKRQLITGLGYFCMSLNSTCFKIKIITKNVRPLIGRLIRIGGRLHVNQPLLNFSERLRRSSWKRIRELEEKQNLILMPRKDSAQSTVEWIPPPPPPPKKNLCSVKRSENCRKILLINFMGFQDKDFSHQKLMRVFLLMSSPSSTRC